MRDWSGFERETEASLAKLAAGDANACRNELEAAFRGRGMPPDDAPLKLKLAYASARDALGRIYQQAGEKDKAFGSLGAAATFLQANRQCHSGDEKTKLEKAELQALLNLSFATLEQGELERSAFYGEKAVELAREIGGEKSPLLAQALFGLSAAYYRLANYDKAEDLIRQAMRIWSEEPPNKEKIATCMNNLGRIMEERGDMKAGIQWHQKAANLRRELPNKLDLAFSLGNLGVALASDGQYAKAVASLREAIKIYDQNGQADSREREGYAYNLGICEQAARESCRSDK